MDGIQRDTRLIQVHEEFVGVALVEVWLMDKAVVWCDIAVVREVISPEEAYNHAVRC